MPLALYFLKIALSIWGLTFLNETASMPIRPHCVKFLEQWFSHVYSSNAFGPCKQ